jgi:hypothetical protein
MLGVTSGGTAYFLYDNLQTQYSEIVSEVRSRGVMIGSTLGKIASEMDQKKRDSQLLLSSAMYEIVRASGERDGQYVVDEIVYLDRNLRAVAHNDVSVIAKGAKKKFEGEGFSKAIHRTKRMTYDVGVEDSFKNDGALPEKLFEQIQIRFPELLAVRYHVSEAVFPVDSEIPSGSIHIFIKNNGFVPYFHRMVRHAGVLFFSAFLVSASSSLILMVILTITSSARVVEVPTETARPEDTGLPAPPAGVRLFRPMAGDEEALPMSSPEPESKAKILDAIPLDDRLRGDP